jgi:hypothetical protein
MSKSNNNASNLETLLNQKVQQVHIQELEKVKQERKERLERQLQSKVVQPIKEETVKVSDYLKTSTGKKIALSASLGFATLLFLGYAISGCDERRIHRYRNSYHTFISQVESGNIDDALNFINPVLAKMSKSSNPQIIEFYNQVNEKYNDVIDNRTRYLEARERRLIDQVLRTTRELYAEGEFEETFVNLTNIVTRLEANSHFSFVQEYIDEVLDWKEQRVVPSLIAKRVRDISSQTSYRERKVSIDDLVSLITDLEFRNKRNVMPQIISLHNNGILHENTVMSNFETRYNSIRETASSNLYVTAHNLTQSLTQDIRNANLIYRTNDSDQLLREVTTFYTRNIRQGYNDRNVLVESVTSQLNGYNNLLRTGPIQRNFNVRNYSINRPYPGHGLETAYFQAERELIGIIRNLDGLLEDQDLKTQANNYLSEVRSRSAILKSSIINYFNSETARWQNLANTGKNQEAKQIIPDLLRQIEEFEKSELYRRNF